MRYACARAVTLSCASPSSLGNSASTRSSTDSVTAGDASFSLRVYVDLPQQILPQMSITFAILTSFRAPCGGIYIMI